MSSNVRDYDLFDNPMVTAAKEAMSPEDLERYKKIGEEMYKNVDFEQSKILNNMEPPFAEATAYLSEQLKSGLHPSVLADNEKQILENTLGKEWYKKWGYNVEDLSEIL